FSIEVQAARGRLRRNVKFYQFGRTRLLRVCRREKRPEQCGDRRERTYGRIVLQHQHSPFCALPESSACRQGTARTACCCARYKGDTWFGKTRQSRKIIWRGTVSLLLFQS